MTPAREDGASVGRRLPSTAAWLAPVVVAVAVAAVYLGPFLDDPGRLPPGHDTPGYVWRADAVHDLGLDALPAFRERPGHPILASVLRDVTGATPLDLARAWPAVVAAAIGLAAAGLATTGAGERPVAGALVALGVAASAFVAVTAVGYAANLVVDLLLVAAVAAALGILAGRGGAAVLVMVVAAAAVTHWLFALVGIVVLGLAAAAPLVRRSEPEARSRAARWLLAAVAIAVLAGGLAMLASPALPDRVVEQTFVDPERRVSRRLPPFALPIAIPAAAVGAGAIAALGRRTARRAAPALVGWAAIAPAGLAAWYLLDLPVPPYRSAGAALGIPFLIVLGPVAASSGSLAGGRRPAAGAAALVAVAATVWLVAGGTSAWWEAEPAVEHDQLAQAATLETYLATLPPGTPAIVPVRPNEPPPPRLLRLGVRARHLASLSLVPADLSAGTEAFVERVRADDPGAVVVAIDAYRRVEPGVGSALGPGVTLLAGPAPSEPLAVPPSRATAGELVRIAALGLGALLASGFGWGLALTRYPAVEVLALAPAIGAAILVLVGLVAGRLGLSFAGGGGAALAITVALAGATVAALRRRTGEASGGTSDA